MDSILQQWLESDLLDRLKIYARVCAASACAVGPSLLILRGVRGENGQGVVGVSCEKCVGKKTKDANESVSH